ncbi:endonuclease domain-containing protein [Chryseobacterium sp. PBS4-4]|uniref:Endonuclease domain-containing protein n=1 Tax=Chryseobacterium edaphi TaxID=2976532 RepID=A0ABT2W950_9FLAO|nr:endonuclease domain-containing protein [Chryseobacterium edaphi]MCU7618738.1 endonuclease domain-containing protein [Chryseobacterium edaphi]
MKKFKSNYDDGMWKGSPSSSFLKAKSLRKNETKEEKILWERLRDNQLRGYKFRRQHPISLFIADFYCHQLKLIIEVDGEYHNAPEQLEKDEERTQILQDNGIKIIRITNHEIKTDISKVITDISLIIDEILAENQK